SSLFLLPALSPTQLFSLSLHHALPISSRAIHGLFLLTGFALCQCLQPAHGFADGVFDPLPLLSEFNGRRLLEIAFQLHQLENLKDRKSTRLNSSHVKISYAVFCLKKTR